MNWEKRRALENLNQILNDLPEEEKIARRNRLAEVTKVRSRGMFNDDQNKLFLERQNSFDLNFKRAQRSFVAVWLICAVLGLSFAGLVLYILFKVATRL